MIVAQCPNSACRRTLELADASAGTRGKCPHCGRAFMVPGRDQAKQRPDAAAPPPLPGSAAAREAPSVAPTPPPQTPPPVEVDVPKRADAGVVGADAPVSRSGIGAKIAILLNEGLVQVLDLKKLLFFVLLGIVGSIVVAIWLGIALLVATKGQSGAAALGFVLIAVIFGLGFLGLMTAGVSRLTLADTVPALGGVTATLRFCMRRVLSLFFAVLVLLIAIFVVSAIGNGLVWLINSIPGVGRPLGALLFVPQLFFNLALVLCGHVLLALPCIMAVDDVGLLAGLTRLGRLAAQRTRALVVFVTSVDIRAGALCVGVGLFVLLALFPTMMSNGLDLGISDMYESTSSPYGSSFGEFGAGRDSSAARSIFGSPSEMPTRSTSDSSAGGDWLRFALMGVAWLIIMALPLVFWIVAFTGFYATVRADLLPARQGTKPTN